MFEPCLYSEMIPEGPYCTTIPGYGVFSFMACMITYLLVKSHSLVSVQSNKYCKWFLRSGATPAM